MKTESNPIPDPPPGVKFDIIKETNLDLFHVWVSKPGTPLFTYRSGPDRVKALLDALEDFYILDPSSKPVN